ncbi:MAG: hypothetical protein IKX88_07645 [Thermoguttaceae bacterium]|nr:hypothetical protein [Thermoguttaceae bacterium]
MKDETVASSLLFLSLWYFWGVRYGDYLYAVQENSLFVFRGEFLTRWLSVPDGALCYLTSFLIQFFYYPLLGGALLAFLGVVVQRLTANLLGWHGGAYAASFLPTCLLTIAATWHGYFVFIPFNTPLMFSSLIGLFFAYAGLWASKAIRSYSRRVFFSLLFVAFGYLLFGCWAVVSGVLYAVYELTFREVNGANWRRNIRRCFVAATIVITIPLALQYFLLYPRLQIYNVFDVGLIEDVRYERDSITALFAYGLVKLTPLCVFALYLTSRMLLFRSESKVSNRRKKQAVKRSFRREKNSASNNKSGSSVENDSSLDKTSEDEERSLAKRRTLLLFELLFLIGAVTFYASYHTRAFFDCLSACRALTRSDWDRILEIDSKNPYPVKSTVSLRNYALFKTGRLAEEAFARPICFYQARALSLEDEAKALAGNPYYRLKVKLHEVKASTERQAHRAMSELLLCYYGLSNAGARMATDNFVATENRSVSCLKALATAAMINGEKNLVRRYLREIAQTLFHKKWANVHLAYLETRDFFEGLRDFHNDPEYSLVESERQEQSTNLLSLSEAAFQFGIGVESLEQTRDLIGQCRAMRPCSNDIRNMYPNLVYLIELFNLSEYDVSPVEKKEFLLISALMQKDGDFFLDHIDDYLSIKGFLKGGAPRAIEQGYATWRYVRYNEKWNECDYKFSPKTLEDMDGFIEFTKAFGVGPQQQVILRRYCAGCYWGFASDDAVYQDE